MDRKISPTATTSPFSITCIRSPLPYLEHLTILLLPTFTRNFLLSHTLPKSLFLMLLYNYCVMLSLLASTVQGWTLPSLVLAIDCRWLRSGSCRVSVTDVGTARIGHRCRSRTYRTSMSGTHVSDIDVGHCRVVKRNCYVYCQCHMDYACVMQDSLAVNLIYPNIENLIIYFFIFHNVPTWVLNSTFILESDIKT